MASSNRDRLIKTFLSRNRRQSSVVDPNFPSNPNPNARAQNRPRKQSVPYKPAKRSSY